MAVPVLRRQPEFFRKCGLALFDCVVGANGCAAATADACIRIDYILVFAGRNCLNGANRLAGAAHYALVCDYVSHFSEI